MAVYFAGALGLLEVIDIVSGPLRLPAWVLKGFIYICIVGFPLTVLISWLFLSFPGIFTRLFDRSGKAKPALSEEVLPELSEPVTDTAENDEVLSYEDQLFTSQNQARSDKRVGTILGISSIAVMLIAGVFFLFYSSKVVPFQERDWVVIADFENLTEEEIFDRSLTTAFSIGIDQSRHISVLPRLRMRETLERMGIQEDIWIDEKLCHEIALREGYSIYMVPEISKVGQQYILSCRLISISGGMEYSSEVVYIRDKNEIIPQLDRLCRMMRRHLGESRYKISRQNKPLARVTTNSLEALKEYSLGLDYHVKLDFRLAVAHYENAIALDSNFTASKAALGNVLFEKFDQEKGRYWLEEAIRNIEDLTDLEKYKTLSFYAAYVEEDLDKSIHYTKRLVELYPNDPSAQNNLGWYYRLQGRYEEAVEQFKLTIQIEPYYMLPYGNLLWTYLSNLGYYDSALYWSNQMIEFGPDNPWGYFNKASAYVALDQLEKAEKEFEKAGEMDPEFIMNLHRQAHTYRLRGDPDKSIEVLEKAIQIDMEEIKTYYDLGVCYGLMGNIQKADEYYSLCKDKANQRKEAFPDDYMSYIWSGLALSRLGEVAQGLEIGKEALEINNSCTFEFAKIMAAQGKKEESLEYLGLTLENGFRDLPVIILDPDLYGLQHEERFQLLLDQYFTL